MTVTNEQIDEAIDWSRFLPTERLHAATQFVWEALHGEVGAIFASTNARAEGSVMKWVGRGDGTVLAGAEEWDSAHWRIIRHADGRWADGYNPSGPCKFWCGDRQRFCSVACRDRAKAKAAEQVPCTTCGAPNCFFHAGRAALHQPAEPSGTGQLPSAPVGKHPGHDPFWCHAGCPSWKAEPPAHGAGTLSDNVLLIDRVDTLEAKLAQAHEDAQRAILAATESLTKDAADLRTKLAQTEWERDEWKRKATAVPMRELPSDIP